MFGIKGYSKMNSCSRKKQLEARDGRIAGIHGKLNSKNVIVS